MEEEEEEFMATCINKFFYYVSFWYVSKTSDPEQFKDLIKFAEQQDLEDRERASVEEASEEESTTTEITEEPAEEDPFEDITEEAPDSQD